MYEHHQQEETVGCFSQGFSGAMSETIQDLLNDRHQSLLSEDPAASSTRASTGMDQWDIPLLPPTCSSTQQIFSGSLTSSFTYNIKTTSSLSDTTNESSLKAQLTMDEPCVQSTSACLHHCKVGSWWKQDCATEPGADITPGEEFSKPMQIYGNEICAPKKSKHSIAICILNKFVLLLSMV